MKRKTKLTIGALATILGFTALGLAGTTAGYASEQKHWGYSGDHGPSHWAKLNPKYATCGTGRRQSPIDIPGTAMGGSGKLSINYKGGAGEAVNNGHAVQINVAQGNSIMVGGKRFDLLQFHFHTPSENTIAGKHFPMEMHLVHKAADGQLAVVAVMIAEGLDGTPIDGLPVPPKAHDTAKLPGGVNPADLLPQDRSYYAFSGSLTTPPCSEQVAWHVMVHPVKVSKATIARMHAAMGNNNRPLNPLNRRNVTVNY